MFLLLIASSFSTSGSRAIVEQGTTLEWHGRTSFPGVFIATADGRLSYVDIDSGDILWSVSTGSPVFSSYSSSSAGYIPTLDGHVLSCTKYGFRRLPFVIRDLSYFSPFRTETGEIFAAGKTVSVLFVDLFSGRVLSSYSGNASIPRQGLEPADSTTVAIVRVDYELSVLSRGGGGDRLRYAEFDIVARGGGGAAVNVTTGLSGGAVLSRGGRVCAQVRLAAALPVAVLGSGGRFEFSARNSGGPFPRDAAQILDVYGARVAVLGAAPRDLPRSAFLVGGLPRLSGRAAPPGAVPALAPGVVSVARPPAPIRPLRAVDPVRPANVVADDPFSLVAGSRVRALPYGGAACALVLCWALLRFVAWALHCARRRARLIRVDSADSGVGYFGGAACELVRVGASELAALQEISAVDGMQSIAAIEEADGCVVVAYRRCDPYPFGAEFDAAAFLRCGAEFLSTLFRNGFVHGGIAVEKVYVDGCGRPVFGGFQHTCRRSADAAARRRDVRRLAEVALEAGGARCSDGFVADLLREMCGDEDDVPTPEEILRHPLFLTATQRLDVYKRASDFVHKRDSGAYMREFDRGLMDIAGCFWTQRIHPLLLAEASAKIMYSGDSLCDLLRMIRNKHEHKPEGPAFAELEAMIGKRDDDDAYFNYFHSLFPNLFLYTYYFLDRYDV